MSARTFRRWGQVVRAAGAALVASTVGLNAVVRQEDNAGPTGEVSSHLRVGRQQLRTAGHRVVQQRGRSDADQRHPRRRRAPNRRLEVHHGRAFPKRGGVHLRQVGGLTRTSLDTTSASPRRTRALRGVWRASGGRRWCRCRWACTTWAASLGRARCGFSRFTWGSLDYGKLGHSLDQLEPELVLRQNAGRSDVNVSQARQPKRVEVFPSGFVARKVVCQYNNTFVIDTAGQVHVLGNTEKGSNGTGRVKGYIKTPQPVTGFNGEPIADIECGNSFCLARSEAGNLYGWGYNNYGQLGGSPNYCEFQPVAVEGLPGGVRQVACGEYFSAALDADGRVFTWGRGDQGQLGHNDKSDLAGPKKMDFPEKIKKISAGDSHLVLLDEAGRVWVTGSGRDGQIGRGDQVESSAKFRTHPMLIDFFKAQGVVIEEVGAAGNHCVASGFVNQMH